MIKKIFKTLLFPILILVILLVSFLVFNNNKGIVKIKNISGETLNNIELIYSNSGEEIKINELKNNETYKHKVKTDIEQALILKFKDENGIEHSNDIVGYIYKGLENENIKTIKITKDYKIE